MRDFSVDDFAAALIQAHGLQDSGYYENGYSQTGFYARLKVHNRYLWFSVSNTDHPLAPDEVALAITQRRREIRREGFYVNRKGVRGFEATVRSGEHFYMLGANNV